MKTLIFFTLEYPYGNSEVFIESEINILSQYFNKIYIIPSSQSPKSTFERSVPDNAIVVDSLTRQNRLVSMGNIFKVMAKFLFLWAFTFFKSKNRLKYIKYWKSFVHYAIDDLLKFSIIKNFVLSNNLKNAIYYDYWMVNSTISLAFLKRKNIIKYFVARCHRFDLYDEVQFEKVVSFREFKVKYLDKIYPISEHGKNYLLDRIDKKDQKKVKLQYLGVADAQTYNPKSNTENSFRIVSCSNVIDFKGVLEIVEVLKQLGEDINWIHFGDGLLMNELVAACHDLPSNIEYELKGNIINEYILEYYASNKIDLFISLSRSEGLPVSIMEAQMHGIPVLARSVCGIPEIINESNGMLIDVNENLVQVSKDISIILQKEFDTQRIIRNCKNKFSAKKNHNEFAKKLISLKVYD